MADNRKTLLESSTSLISAHYSLVKALFMAAPFFASQAYAQTCSPVPSCVSLGYSKSSAACTNKISCPFDTSYTICLDPTETKPKTCADFGYYSQGNLADLKKKGCEHPDSKYCVCNELSAGEEATLAGLLCYSTCSEPTMTCSKINSSYLSTEAEARKSCVHPNSEYCRCAQISDDEEVTMRNLTCFSPCAESSAITCETMGYTSASALQQLKNTSCSDPTSANCTCTQVTNDVEVTMRGLTCYSACAQETKTCEDFGYVSEANLSKLKNTYCSDVSESKCECPSVSTDAELNAARLTCYSKCAAKVLTEEECIAKYGKGYECGINCWVYDYKTRPEIERGKDPECAQYILDCICSSGPGA